MIDTVVFLGPSLPLQKAKEIFPEAAYHAPARCGDLFRVLRLKPKKIVLIDGFFETVPSVWHKEILFAIEQGVAVYGASSMGALRAAELANFGMIGVGKIFRDFYNGVIDNDDAVAVLHADKQNEYRPVNEALVDFQATLEAALEEGDISLEQKREIYEEINNWFYPERTIQRVAHEAKKGRISFQSFYAWIQAKGLIPQKKLDAIEVLERARSERGEAKEGRKVPKTKFIRTLATEINLSVFPENYDWLPVEEKELIALKQQHPQRFYGLTQIGFALSVSSDTESALSRASDGPDRIKWSHFFSEIFDDKKTADLFARLFLATTVCTEDYKDPDQWEKATSSFCDPERIKEVSQKMGAEEMAKKVFHFYYAHRNEHISNMQAKSFESVNWIASAYKLFKAFGGEAYRQRLPALSKAPQKSPTG